jgi:hypothetical protein
MPTDKFTQISVSGEFVSIVESASSEVGASFLSFIKLSVLSMARADQEERIASMTKLKIAEASWSNEKIKKTIRITPAFKELVVDTLVPEFNNNASLLYRTSALRMANMNTKTMKVEIMTALEESIRQNYNITIR